MEFSWIGLQNANAQNRFRQKLLCVMIRGRMMTTKSRFAYRMSRNSAYDALYRLSVWTSRGFFLRRFDRSVTHLRR
jgi:hypothetical protein